MRNMIKIGVAVLIFLFAMFVFVSDRPLAQTQTETAGQKFKNIKVLNDIPADQLGKVMNIMSASLGVKCSFCHVSDDGDFDKDTKKEKETAREMVTMTFELNKNHFENRLEISCNTCHNGRSHPVSAPNLYPAVNDARPQQPEKKPAVDDILTTYETALGGKANLAKIASRHILAKRLEPDGKTFESEEIWQKPGKILVSTKYTDYLVNEGFDGTSAWKKGNKDKIPLHSDEAEQIKREAQIFANPNLEAIYPKMEFRFVDRIDGREVYLILATTAENSRERLYFDSQTGLLVRRAASAATVLGNFQYQIDYADYKSFGGVKLPTTVKFAVPNIRWTRKVLKVTNNAAVDDAKFMK